MNHSIEGKEQETKDEIDRVLFNSEIFGQLYPKGITNGLGRSENTAADFFDKEFIKDLGGYYGNRGTW